MHNLEALEGLRNRVSCLVDETALYCRFAVPERARGMRVWFLDDEQPFLDLVLGFGALNFGHCHPRIISAAEEALSRLTHIHSFNTEAKLVLSERLVSRLSCPEEYRVYYDVGGSSAVSRAAMLCRLRTSRPRLSVLGGSFHGCIGVAAALSDPRLLDRSQVSPQEESSMCRIPFPGDEASEQTCLGEAARVFEQGDVAAVFVEAVQGAAGFRQLHAPFLQELWALAREHDVLYVADEIQVGLGRTGQFTATPLELVEPDVLLLSKSLGGGVFPLSAVIARKDLFESVPVRGTALQSTFANNALGCHVGLTVLDLMEEPAFMESVLFQGKALLQALKRLEEMPFVGSVSGVGLALAITVVDPAGGGGSAAIAKDLVEHAFDERVLVYAAGPERNIIKLAPPLTVREPETSFIAEEVHRVLCSFEGKRH